MARRHPTQRRERLTDEVYREIVNWLVQSHLPAGAQLPTDREFSLRFKTSTTTVTHALKLLETEGVVDKQPRRGTYLRTPLKRPYVADVYLPAEWREPLESCDLTHHSYFIYREYLDGIARGGAAFSIATCIEYVDYAAADSFRLTRSVTCDGALLAVSRAAHHEYFARLRIPHARLTIFAPEPQPNQVTAGPAGLRQGLDALFALGHRDLGLLSQAIPAQNVSDRYRGTIDRWFSERRLRLRDAAVCCAKRPEEDEPFTPENVAPRLRAYLRRAPLPTAVISTSPIFTRAFCSQARALGLRIPRDVSVLNIGSPNALAMLTPRIATVDLHYAQTAYEAMRLLADMLESGRAAAAPVVVESSFVAGESLAAPRGDTPTCTPH